MFITKHFKGVFLVKIISYLKTTFASAVFTKVKTLINMLIYFKGFELTFFAGKGFDAKSLGKHSPVFSRVASQKLEIVLHFSCKVKFIVRVNNKSNSTVNRFRVTTPVIKALSIDDVL